MRNFRDYDRSQRLLLPPDLRDWVADEDLAHFIVAAVERVDISAFHVSRTGSGKAQYHSRMMLALLVYCYAGGIFSSGRFCCWRRRRSF
jgi:transposase